MSKTRADLTSGGTHILVGQFPHRQSERNDRPFAAWWGLVLQRHDWFRIGNEEQLTFAEIPSQLASLASVHV